MCRKGFEVLRERVVPYAQYFINTVSYIYIFFVDTILDPDCYQSSRMSNSQHAPKTLIVEMLKVTQHSAVMTPRTHTHTDLKLLKQSLYTLGLVR